MADQQFSDETKKQMRDTVLRWIGEGEKPSEIAPAKDDKPQLLVEDKNLPATPSEEELDVATENAKVAPMEAPSPELSHESTASDEEVPVVTEKIADFVGDKKTEEKTTVPTSAKTEKSKKVVKPWSNWLKSFSGAPQASIEDKSGLKYFLIVGAAIVIAWSASFLILRQGYLNPSAREFLAKYVPVPYARLGSHLLWLPTWYDEREAIDHYYQQNQSAGVDITQTRDIASTAMVRRAMLEELASQYKIRVSEAEIDAEVTRLQSNMGSTDSLNRLVQTIWGWSLADFKGKLIRPYLLKQKLIVKLKEDPVLGRDFGQSSDQQILDQYLDKLAKSQLSQWINLDRLP